VGLLVSTFFEKKKVQMESDLDRVYVAVQWQQQQQRLGQVVMTAAVHRRNPTNIVEALDQPLESRSHFILSVFEFLDNHQLSSLDALIQQIGSREVQYIIPDDSTTTVADGSIFFAKKVNALFEAKSIVPVTVKKSYFSKKPDTLLILNRNRESGTSQQHVVHRVESERSMALGSIECLWQVLDMRNLLLNAKDTDTERIDIEVELGALDKFMRLDSAAAEAVHLLPRHDQPSQFGSLLGILNKCKTKLGSRTLER
jgi:DNA mismatch repair ATPase MutS